MPSFVINTNVPKTVLPEKFHKELTTILADLLGKPEKFVAVQVNPDQLLTFAGTHEPAAVCFLNCIGKIGVEENRIYTQTLMEKLNNDLGIAKDRMYITFSDIARQDCGWNGKTFAT